MAIQNDFFVDYQNKLIAHASHQLEYDTKTATFNIGATVTGSLSGATGVIVNDVRYLAYDNQTVDFTIGATVTGGTSNATGIIVSDTDAGTSGTLGIVSVTGSFDADDGEALTDSSGGAATSNVGSGITTGLLDLVYVNGTFQNNDVLSDNGPTPGGATANGVAAAKTTVYTSRALYSFIQNTFDELGQMDDTVPMSAQTPTEFTMINGWFIDDESTKYLSGGAISTSGYDDVIQVVTLNAGATAAIPTDIGKTVMDGATPRGTLLHYNNTTRKWWVRYATQIGSAVALTISSGTGAGTTSAASSSGEDLYANIYTLGTITIDPKPKTYVFQNGSSIAEWWGRGDSAAHIDVLIKVKEADIEIDGANITVFTRHFGDLFDHFPIDLSSGGRNAVPLATATDLNNNTLGEITVSYTGQAGGNFTVGNFVRDIVTGAYGEILVDSDSGTTGTLTIGNVIIGSAGSGDFTGTNGLAETTTGLAAGDTGVTATIGTVTPVARSFNNIKILFMNITLPFTSGGTTEPTVGDHLQGATSSADAYYISSTLTSGTWAGGNAVGTMYLANWDSTPFNGTEAINNVTQSQNDIATTSSAQTVEDEVTKAFEQGTAYPYNVVVSCANRTMAQVYEWFKYVTREDANSTQPNYQTMFRVSAGTTIVQEDGEEYISALSTYSPVKASPFGTLAGGKLFAARGVWVESMATADRQNFQLIDANGTTRTPPNFITITVSSVVSGDKVTVFRTSSGTTINKVQFASGHSNDQNDAQFFVTSTIPSDTPNSGYIRVVDTSDTSINRERRYAYSSWSNTTSSFTLSGSTVLDRTYSAGEDTAYVPYYDEVAANTSVYVTVIYNADQTVLTRVRRYGGSGNSILPFEITGNVGSTGYSVAAIRTADTIVT